ncbi:CoA-binding protein [Aliikangiella sp. IMCC44359]|uniref:CoA-binding protein n=1 Tax=Aliikangiella sp. IMCC44359 TaxID=3459125 RepID=UPI00403A8F50
MKPTLILGASSKEERFSNRAQKKLINHKHPVILVSKKETNIEGIPCYSDITEVSETIDTVTLYINPSLVVAELNKIIQLAPKRVIFNPGTESEEAILKLEQAGIKTVEDCTLIMLNNRTY